LRHALRSATLALAAAVAAGCGTMPPAAGPDSSTASSDRSAMTLSLVGPTWRLSSLGGRPAVPGTRVTAVFADSGQVVGSAGCNQYFGGAAATGARLAVGLLGSTRMYCGADGVMDQESAYLAALQGATTFQITGAQLRLASTSGVTTLVFDAE
jgi:heat shock protein HslJ